MKMIFKSSLTILLAALMLLSVVSCSKPQREEVGMKVPEDTTAAPCDHTYEESIQTPALPLKDGVKLFTCSKCNDSYTEAIPMTKTLKILAVGNSFSSDAMEYLWQVCKDGGVETIVLGNLYIGGCTLDTHRNNILKNSPAYTYYKNTNGKWNSTPNTAPKTAFEDESWDIVTLQQASGSSGIAKTYVNLPELFNMVSENNQGAKVYWHMTWAYQQNSTHKEFPNYSKNQMTMYNAIVDATKTNVVDTNLDIVGVIPSGTAIQNLRSSYVGDTVTRDGYHMSNDYGRYTVALTWYAYLTGGDVANVDWVPPSYPELSKNLDVVRDSIKNALEKPFEVTKSSFTKNPNPVTPTPTNDAELFTSKGFDINNYEALDWGPMVAAFYNSTHGTHLTNAGNSSSSLIPKFIASRIISKSELPVGSIIIVDSGYQYRPEGWENESYKANGNRPGNVSTNFVPVTEDWWGSFTLRGFNISATNSKVMSESDIPHFRIYVPKAG